MEGSKMEKTVEVSHVSKSFNGQSVAKDISFDIAPGEIFIMLIFASGYFILGYLVFACIMAGVGAMPLIISQLIISKPDSIISIIFSYFPLTSPITMIMRISTGGVQYYEVVLSLLILTVSILVIIEMSVKIFRASLLMYGKKPTITEVLKYVR
jgi:ABC-2 type transport system permease protein